MPNWCENYVTIKGHIKELDKIAEACRQKQFLEYLEPIGEWDYDKAVEAWGTKWEPQLIDWEIDVNAENSTMTLSFPSAWAPPVQAYYAAEQRLPVTIEAYYIEEGYGFVGFYENGTESTYELDYDKEDMLESIPDRLVEEFDLEQRQLDWQEWNAEEENEDA